MKDKITQCLTSKPTEKVQQFLRPCDTYAVTKRKRVAFILWTDCSGVINFPFFRKYGQKADVVSSTVLASSFFLLSTCVYKSRSQNF